MKIYRCDICGEVYLGTEPPTRCPYCGAAQKEILPTEEYALDINEVELTDSERADIEHAVELEVHDSRYYITMAGRDKESALGSAYKRLSKIEQEHCELFCKLLKRDVPENLTASIEIAEGWCEDIDASISAESHAAQFYAEIAERATTKRVKEVFSIISKVELDHVDTNNIAKGMAGC